MHTALDVVQWRLLCLALIAAGKPFSVARTHLPYAQLYATSNVNSTQLQLVARCCRP
jgi:hypothetical protein